MNSISELDAAPSVSTHTEPTLEADTGAAEMDSTALSTRPVPSLPRRSVSEGGSPLFSISPEDLAEFNRLPNSKDCPVRDDLRLTLRLLRRIHFAPNKSAERRIIAAELHQRRGFTAESLKRKYSAYTSTADWRALIDRARAPIDDSRTLKYDFINFVVSLAESFQRTGGFAAAHRCLLKIWRTRIAPIDLNINGKLIRRGHPVPMIPGYSSAKSSIFNPQSSILNSPSSHGERAGVRGVASLAIGDCLSAIPKNPQSSILNPQSPTCPAEASSRRRVLNSPSWPQADWHGQYPPGWSYDNLKSVCERTGLKNNFALTAARIGRSAAASFRQKTLTTRVGLLLGEFFQFDDDVNDVKVNHIGNQRRIMRPLGLSCLDYLSAHICSYGFKPTIWDDAADAKKVLVKEDMFWFVVNVLTQIGYRDDSRGTTLIVEHGTAAIDSEFEQRIADATGGKVKVQRSGIDRRPVAPGMFEGLARGNFRFKASLESFFNLKRNEFAALPGATGKDRAHSPEQLPALERYNQRLLLASSILNPQSSISNPQFITPFLSWSDFLALAMDLMDTINRRTTHNLEGWEKLGFVKKQFRLPGTEVFLPYTSFSSLPAVTQQSLSSLFLQDPTLTRIEKLSPHDVFTSQRDQLRRLRPSSLCDLLGEALGFETPAVNREGEIVIERQDIDTDPLHYTARINNARLPEGEKYFAFLNPYAPDRLALYDASRRYIGSIERFHAVSRNDIDAFRRQLGKVRQQEADDLIPLAARGAHLAQREIEMRQHNTEILSAIGDRPSAIKSRDPLKAPTTAEWDRKQARLAKQAEQARAIADENLNSSAEAPSEGGSSIFNPQSSIS